MSLGLRYGQRHGVRFGVVGGASPIPDPTGPAGTLLPWPVEAFTWGLQWRTDVMGMRNGTEYRQALNTFPREIFDVEFLLDTTDARYVRELLKTNAARVFHLPIRILDVPVTTAVTGVDVGCDVSLVDWAVVGQRVMIEGPGGDTHATYITAVGGGIVTIADAVPITFGAEVSRLVPLSCVYLDDKANAGLYTVNAGSWSVKARAFLPLTVLGGGGTAPATYAGSDLLEEAIDVDGTASEAIDAGIDAYDAGGAFAISTSYLVANVQRGGAFTIQSALGRQTWLRFLVARNGRQVTFWNATYRADFDVTTKGVGTLTVAAPIAFGTAYVTTWAAGLVGSHIRVGLVGAAARYYQIAAATVGGATVLLDVTGASIDLTGVTIALVSRLERVRLASDEVAIVDESAGLLSFDLPTIVVPQ